MGALAALVTLDGKNGTIRSTRTVTLARTVVDPLTDAPISDEPESRTAAVAYAVRHGLA